MHESCCSRSAEAAVLVLEEVAEDALEADRVHGRLHPLRVVQVRLGGGMRVTAHGRLLGVPLGTPYEERQDTDHSYRCTRVHLYRCTLVDLYTCTPVHLYTLTGVQLCSCTSQINS